MGVYVCVWVCVCVWCRLVPGSTTIRIIKAHPNSYCVLLIYYTNELYLARGSILTKPDLFQFRMGNNKASTNGPYHQIRTAEKIFMHPDYTILSADSYDSDVALFKLKEPFVITDYVRTVCLPTESMAADFPATTPVTVTGWGATEDGELKALYQLRKSVSKSWGWYWNW